MLRRCLVVLPPLVVAACTLTTSLDGFTGGDTPAVSEGGSDGGAEGSSADRAAPPPGVLGKPSIIVSDVGGSFAAGAAQSTHLYYASNAAQWVLFYLNDSDPTHLRTRVSADFVTWSDGAALALPEQHPRDGRDFAVAYADLGGHDVFHLAIGVKSGNSDRRHLHVRAVFSGKDLAYDSPNEIAKSGASDSQLDPDGPAVAVMPDGKVLDVSGWYTQDGGGGPTGNIISWVSTQSDTGGAWPSTFTSPVEVFVVPDICNARTLAVTPTRTLAVWETADNEPNPKGISFASFEDGSWGSAKSVGFDSSTLDPNDWGAAAQGATVHAVRYAASSGYAHRVNDGGQWRAGADMPARDHPIGQGVVVLPDTAAMLALTLDTDSAISSTSFANSAWSPWKTELAGGAQRTRLSGYAGDGGVVVIWIETVSSRKDIVGARVR